MVEWAVLGTWVQAVAVLVGVAFAMVQLRLLRTQRKELAAIEILRSFQSPDFKHASWIVLSLPIEANEVQIEARGARDSIHGVMATYEAMAVMVFHRQLPLAILDDLTGGFVRAAWARLGPHVARVRREHDFPNYGEWFEWLAKRLEENPSPGKKEGAYAYHANWRP
jgi:hypothetical protein